MFPMVITINSDCLTNSINRLVLYRSVVTVPPREAPKHVSGDTLTDRSPQSFQTWLFIYGKRLL